MATTARQQPPWTPPSAPGPEVLLPPLKIYNSLTRKKETFIPIDRKGKEVLWYICGPTVYDDSHLGHARNYTSSDVIRRIMKDYFGFNVKYCMNITDIDDKIILRGRQQYLLGQMKERYTSDTEAAVPEELKEEAEIAWRQYTEKQLPLIPKGISPKDYELEMIKAYKRVLNGEALNEGETPGDKEAKIKMHINTARSAAEAVGSPGTLLSFYTKTEDVLLPYLDSLHGLSIKADDYSIFTKLTQKMEKSFFADMHALNVQDPDVLVRVTEFVPQIVTFVEKIIANGFAYDKEGSVYFDIAAFEKAGYPYARLEPWNKADSSLAAEGEGALSAAGGAKKNDADFALWKGSKAGEPSWPSPWGPGRPGWHIECSVMASETFGQDIDIHSGGIDLAFPHHDNELCQSEAFFCKKTQWVNYFLHAGHLSIAGSKMSKSLKNFTTIKKALETEQFTPRSLRLSFLLGAWDSGIEITDSLLLNTKSLESKLDNFFLKARDVQRYPSPPQEPSEKDPLLESLRKTETDVYNAFCDSFNTPQAMQALSGLVTEYNSAKNVSDETTSAIARYITRIVTTLGLDSEGDLKDESRVGWSGIDIPEESQPFVYPASQLRDAVRSQVKAKEIDYEAISSLAESTVATEAPSDASKLYASAFDNFKAGIKQMADQKAPAKDLLVLCDLLRDSSLWDLGIYLEDREDRPALVRPLDASLITARQEKESAQKAKAEAKAKREAEEAEKKRLLAEKAKTPPGELFKTEDFSEWDEQGIPTKEKSGDDVSKAKRKKMVKEWEKQKKMHEEYLKSQGEGGEGSSQAAT